MRPAVGVVAGGLRTLFGILVLSLPFLLILLVLVRLLFEQVVVVLSPGASAGAPAAALRVQVTVLEAGVVVVSVARTLGGGRRPKHFFIKGQTRTL